MTTFDVPIGNVAKPSYLRVKLQDPDIQGGKLLEVYAGVFIADIGHPAGDIVRSSFRTFLPIKRETVRSYPKGSITCAAMASPSVFVTSEEDCFIGVDSCTVELEELSLPGFLRTMYIILTVHTALANSTLVRIAYNVSVACDTDFVPDPPHELDPTQMPRDP